MIFGMPSNLVVIDASVAVKWFHEEPDTPQAEALEKRIARGEIRALAPSLLFYEVANALVFKAGSELTEIIAAYNILTGLPFQIVEVVHTLLEDAIRIAHHHRISVYDAIYVALALFSGAVLVTADKKLVDAMHSSTVQHLSEFAV